MWSTVSVLVHTVRLIPAGELVVLRQRSVILLAITLHYTTLYYTTLHYTTLHYTILHYTTPYQILFLCLCVLYRMVKRKITLLACGLLCLCWYILYDWYLLHTHYTHTHSLHSHTQTHHTHTQTHYAHYTHTHFTATHKAKNYQIKVTVHCTKYTVILQRTTLVVIDTKKFLTKLMCNFEYVWQG